MRFKTFAVILAGLILAGIVACHGQSNAGRPNIPLNLPSPSSISTIRYWWVASDLSLGAVSGNWSDRINAYGLGQATAANRPTNTASGVFFNGSPTSLTNSPGGWQWATNGTPHRGSVWVVVAPTTPPASIGGIVGSTNASGYGLYTTSAKVYRNFATAGSPTFGSWQTNVFQDVALVITEGSTNTYFTNGVQAANATAGDINGGQLTVGRDNQASPGYYKGYIQEIAWFADYLTPAQIVTLHTYATNRYSYTP